MADADTYIVYSWHLMYVLAANANFSSYIIYF